MASCAAKCPQNIDFYCVLEQARIFFQSLLSLALVRLALVGLALDEHLGPKMLIFLVFLKVRCCLGRRNVQKTLIFIVI